jgi:hypothetical protein
MGFGVWGLGFGVWGLGFGVWGLGFGVWGLGFGFGGWGFIAQISGQTRRGTHPMKVRRRKGSRLRRPTAAEGAWGLDPPAAAAMPRRAAAKMCPLRGFRVQNLVMRV